MTIENPLSSRLLMKKLLSLVAFCVATCCALIAQTADIKGFVYDKKTGQRLSGVSVYCDQENRSTTSNEDGFFAFTGVLEGKILLVFSKEDYDSASMIHLVNRNMNQLINVYLQPIAVTKTIIINAKGQINTPKIGEPIEQRQILKMPSVGGEPDILQYLQILPGVVFSGDQGGQLYIRGGSPIMNKVTLDGMTIYNPFHSIGLFSVFETDLVKSANVYSAAFGAEYGGRVGAVVDVKTRDGNLTAIKTKTTVGTFTSKVLVEGPLKKFEQLKGSSSFALSLRGSYLRQSSKIFYNYANPERLPFNFADFFGKVTLNGASGGYLKLYGFRYSDNVKFNNSTNYDWTSTGFGGKFLVIPEAAKTRVDGYFLYSKYDISQVEPQELLLGIKNDRNSNIGGFNLGMNFTYQLKRDEIKWGIDLNGFQTDFNLFNSNNRKVNQLESTTEINSFVNYEIKGKKILGNIGLRNQTYASLGNKTLEPRLNFAYKPFSRFIIKTAVGSYSQNLLSATSDRDVVNLFYGFLSGPDNLPTTFDGKPVKHRLQKSNHAAVSFEYFHSRKASMALEGFVKIFGQVTNINRDKLFEDNELYQDKPERLRQDYIVENGNAYGGDVWYKYDSKKWYIWAVYSLTYVNRYDGYIHYQPIFDRRHNANILISYQLDRKHFQEISLRWNLGSGFPFTQTQGLFEKIQMNQGVSSNYVNSNGTMGIIYAPLNQGRLPYYHRLDLSYRRSWKWQVKEKVREIGFLISITNVYNRANIFYFDRINLTRVNQLPFLPAMSLNYSF